MVFHFETQLAIYGSMGAIMVPDDIAQQLTIHKVKRVVASIKFHKKELTLHAGITKRKGLVYLMFSKANQKFLAVEKGDTLEVQMREDTSKYQAPMTEELAAVLLSDYEAYEIFEKLTPGKQRNIIFMNYRLTDSQKRVDTALNAMENLKIGNLEPMKFEKLL